MGESMVYVVPGLSCGHCESAVSKELHAVPGVRVVEVDLDTKRVVVLGALLDDAALRDAIAEAGYEAA